MNDTVENRRPIKSRSSGWAKSAASALAKAGVSANAISVASVVFAAGAAAALLLAPSVPLLFLVAAVLCPLRLLANLFDGMVAVEHGSATTSGPIYNELPDRLSDVLVIAALGHAAALSAGTGPIADWGGLVGWLGAVAALLTAYVRELGRGLGAPADFSGPLAKQHRMWVVVAAAVAAFVVSPLASLILFAASVVILVGTTLTVVRRLSRLAGFLAGRDPS